MPPKGKIMGKPTCLACARRALRQSTCILKAKAQQSCHTPGLARWWAGNRKGPRGDSALCLSVGPRVVRSTGTKNVPSREITKEIRWRPTDASRGFQQAMLKSCTVKLVWIRKANRFSRTHRDGKRHKQRHRPMYGVGAHGTDDVRVRGSGLALPQPPRAPRQTT